MSKAGALTPAYRWAVFSRVMAAVFGGYALSSAATVLIALLWPASKAQGLLWATQLSFVVYTVAIIWVFSTRSATRAWWGMVIGTVVCSGLAWLLQKGGGA